MEELDKILENAEKFMEKAETESTDHIQVRYQAAIYIGIKALYEQNKAIIELLKNYQK